MVATCGQYLATLSPACPCHHVLQAAVPRQPISFCFCLSSNISSKKPSLTTFTGPQPISTFNDAPWHSQVNLLLQGRALSARALAPLCACWSTQQVFKRAEARRKGEGSGLPTSFHILMSDERQEAKVCMRVYMHA